MPTVTAVTIVNISIPNNAWWDDSFQFGTPGDVSWSFTNKTFSLDAKVNASDLDTAAVLRLSSANPGGAILGNTITVTDVTQRILTMNVTDHQIRASGMSTTGGALGNGSYVYDLIMTDNGSGQRDMLMKGTITLEQGVTIED